MNNSASDCSMFIADTGAEFAVWTALVKIREIRNLSDPKEQDRTDLTAHYIYIYVKLILV
jgi:hypothetical protein